MSGTFKVQARNVDTSDGGVYHATASTLEIDDVAQIRQALWRCGCRRGCRLTACNDADVLWNGELVGNGVGNEVRAGWGADG